VRHWRESVSNSEAPQRLRNPHHALQALRRQVVTGRVSHVFEADIRSYFTRIDHQWLRRMVAHRIADPIILRLISKWLKAGAFGHVAGALTFFVNYYTYLAGFKSVVDRLNSFDAAIDQAQALSDAGPKRIASVGGTPRIDLEDVNLFLPDGRGTVETKHLVLAEGESVVLSGPSGSGKSTLFRAIAGIWPFGAGGIRSPAGIRMMVVPAKPYIPISTLRAAVTYPGVPGTYSDDDIRRALTDAHLGDLVSELNREEVWSQHLSSGEQQRVALARALLMKPDWLFLDESTSAVDERLEADLTPHWRGGYRRRRSCPSAIARRSSAFTSATSRCARKAITSRSAIPRRWWRQSDQ
jgi:ABC-type multidrug transport system fused ATPase/permease subunit